MESKGKWELAMGGRDAHPLPPPPLPLHPLQQMAELPKDTTLAFPAQGNPGAHWSPRQTIPPF